MVLLIAQVEIYQYPICVVDLKYRDRDITESSFVFSRSKGEKASSEPLLSKNPRTIP